MLHMTSKAQIKAAVKAGLTVHWSNDGYTVKEDSKGQWFIVFHTGYCVGLESEQDCSKFYVK